MSKLAEKQDLIKNLVETDLYKNIKDDVFLAFREPYSDEKNRCNIDLYYGGGKLFLYDKKGFKTHIKYASIINAENEDKNYLYGYELEGLKLISEFSKDNIKRIQENCALYSGTEAKGVAKIYKDFSYKNKKETIVVLDIEIAFKAIESGYKQDRIDILLLDTTTQKLHFVEAKHFSNGDLRSTTPDVIKQISRYEQQIEKNKKEILKKYSDNIEILNKYFDIDLKEPKEIDEKVTLLIFGFDEDQKNGKLKKLITNNEKYKGTKFYAKGSTADLTPKNIIQNRIQL